MPPVNTVLGPVDPADLGFTLSHEHVLLSAAGVSHTYPGFIDHQQVTDDGAVELKGAYDEGVRTIIDVTTFDLGRDIRLLAEVSRRSGVHIVACTGNHLAVPRGFAVAPRTRWPLSSYVRSKKESKTPESKRESSRWPATGAESPRPRRLSSGPRPEPATGPGPAYPHIPGHQTGWETSRCEYWRKKGST